MKPHLFLLLAVTCLFSTSLFSQTQPVRAKPVVVNTPAAVGMMKIADTTSLKIKKLQEDNQKQQQELAELKATVADLKTKYNQDHVELGIAKLTLKNVPMPVAYAAFNPEKNSGGNYEYKLAAQYGIKGGPTQSYGSVYITLNHSFTETPVIITSISEDYANIKSVKPVGVVTYVFVAPNTIRFEIKEVGSNDVFAPFSVLVYGK